MDGLGMPCRGRHELPMGSGGLYRPGVGKARVPADRRPSLACRARLTTLRPGIGAFHLRHPQFVMLVPALLAELLGSKMPGVLLPGADGCFIGEIGDRNPQTTLPAHGFRAQAARLLEGQLEHGFGHGAIALIARFSLRGEDHRVIGRLGRVGKTGMHGRSPSVFRTELFTWHERCVKPPPLLTNEIRSMACRPGSTRLPTASTGSPPSLPRLRRRRVTSSTSS